MNWNGITIAAVITASAVVIWLIWRWIIRQCEAAHVADWGGRWLNRLDGLNRLFCRKYHRLQHDDLGLPEVGGALIASNHVSGLDPMLLIASSPRPLRFVIAWEEYDRWWLRWLFQAMGCIPVKREANPRAALYAARDALERGEVVALFPHGRIYLDHEPPAPLKRGVVLLAQMQGVPIYPVRVEGIRGKGLIIKAVFLRSRARVRVFPHLHCEGMTEEECLRHLGDILTVNNSKERIPQDA